jgi:hypothetical protein
MGGQIEKVLAIAPHFALHVIDYFLCHASLGLSGTCLISSCCCDGACVPLGACLLPQCPSEGQDSSIPVQL